MEANDWIIIKAENKMLPQLPMKKHQVFTDYAKTKVLLNEKKKILTPWETEHKPLPELPKKSSSSKVSKIIDKFSKLSIASTSNSF